MKPTRDATPESGAETDVAPLGRGVKPAHERNVREDLDVVAWSAVARSRAFKNLLAAKRRLIVPLTVFFVLYYFALPLSVGFFPEVMNRPVFGKLNLAYAFALSQFVMAWSIAAIYLRASTRWDGVARDIASDARQEPRA